MGDATLAQAPRRAEEEMHSNALDALRDAPEKRRMAKHRIGKEKNGKATPWRRNAK